MGLGIMKICWCDFAISGVTCSIWGVFLGYFGDTWKYIGVRNWLDNFLPLYTSSAALFQVRSSECHVTCTASLNQRTQTERALRSPGRLLASTSASKAADECCRWHLPNDTFVRFSSSLSVSLSLCLCLFVCLLQTLRILTPQIARSHRGDAKRLGSFT